MPRFFALLSLQIGGRTFFSLTKLNMLDLGFDRYLVRLRFTRSAYFHFNHGGVLMGLFCKAMQTHDLPAGVMPFACESGRVPFAQGDHYHIGLTLVGAARQSFNIESFRNELQRIGSRSPDQNIARPTFGGNFEVISIETLPQPDSDRGLAQLRSSGSLSMRFLSPFRLERPPELKEKGAGFLNRDCFPLEHFMRRFAKRLFLLAHDRYPDAHECDSVLPLSYQTNEWILDGGNLLWLDLPLEGGPDKGEYRPKGYTIGGVVGKVTVKNVPEAWLPPLLLGQYVHAGEKTHYGLGRYVIEECYEAQTDPFRPARTLFEDLIVPSVLQEALSHIVGHSTASGVDGYAPDDAAKNQDLLAEQVSDALRGGTYRPASLLGFVTPKDKAGLRPLVVPTVRDRMVQRAACTLLSPAIEKLLEDCAYAYRKGFSRAGAARAIERAYDEGYRYILDADIESFFDAVEWPRLFAKLEALFPYEPLVSLIKEWVQSPVIFERTEIRRERGLPQGIAISPLLANLYLDEFDEELLGNDYRMVRYGDDFVVLCKDLKSAQQASEDVRAKLGSMGLKLNEEKTAIRSFDEGFTYLGYLFCRALVLESKQGSKSSPAELTTDAIPSASWLAQVPFERVRALVHREAASRHRPAISAVELEHSVKVAPLVPLGSQELTGIVSPVTRPLYVSSFDTTVQLEGETLSVCAPEREPLKIPIRSLSHVVCYGKVRISVPVLLALSEEGIPTYFCYWSGELRGIFVGPPADWRLWMAQARLAEDEAARVGFAREVVAAKLHNYAALAVRFKLARAEAVADELRELERSCVNKTTLDALNGLEGRGAAVYFGAMGETLVEEWGFKGRRTQPPPDPVNAMLSFGYTLLYHQLSTALLAAGLNPRIGLYHTERGAYHALACDLQEEFRHLVDAHVWALINRREVKRGDFYASEDGRYPCLMNQAFRRKFIAAFEKRLSSEFTPPGGDDVMTYKAYMDRQARQIRDFVTGHLTHYSPLRTRG